MEIEFKGTSFEFETNPEQYEVKIQSRVNLTYTKMGAFIDKFGEGVKEITLSGTTGFKGSARDPNHGYNKYKALKSIMESEMQDVEDGKEIKDFMTFYNHTDGEGYVVVPIRISLFRNVNQPLLYKYDMAFYAIRNAGDPVPTQAIQVIGNPLGTPTTASETVKDRDEIEKGGTEDTKFTETNKVKAKEDSKTQAVYNLIDSTGKAAINPNTISEIITNMDKDIEKRKR